ncbi:uncharacterized protein pdgfbb isoform X2 [Mugil cephalus]|uniref:uncharacterized protein pdgfbb isoform X2 n=1 Tax=Mugil cephalus TaxID=48193 RepID=UPI001FB618B8|nr:uncharacterized protein pdgfbb isoform X2 [Mugil cephalus]
MRSWVRLLFALLATTLRFGESQGEVLPAALVELVRNNPISSIEDLQLLLLSDSTDEEDEASAANGGHRTPRSLNAQPAQQALCKVRTEVVEVTRAMLDRSNAHFLLWPPCVEVQRCSGCCNTKSLQCVPVITHTRYLQVMKIEYNNKRPTYTKAVVAVLDHVDCRCQPRPPPSRKKTPRRHHRNQTLIHGHTPGQVKVQSKDELHQWDELKRNQRVHLDDLHWSSRGDTFSQPGDGEDGVGFGPHWAHNASTLLGTRDGSEVQEDRTVRAKNRTTDVLLNRTEGDMNEVDTATLVLSQDGSSQRVTPQPQTRFMSTEDTIRFRPTKEPNPEPRPPSRRRDNETPEDQRSSQRKEDRKEVLVLNWRLDQEETLKQMKREDEDRLKETETDGGTHVHHLQTTTPGP